MPTFRARARGILVKNNYESLALMFIISAVIIIMLFGILGIFFDLPAIELSKSLFVIVAGATVILPYQLLLGRKQLSFWMIIGLILVVIGDLYLFGYLIPEQAPNLLSLSII